MQEADRKLAWSAVIVLAVIAAELAWIIAAGTAGHGPNAASQQETQQNEPWRWIISAAFWTAAFTGVLTYSTVKLWRETRRLAEGADDQSKKMIASIAAAEKSADAATIAARAAVAAETPVVFVNDISLWDLPPPGIESSGSAPVHGVPPRWTTVWMEFKNYGRTPARLMQLFVDNRVLKELPAEPRYVLGGDLRSGAVIAAGATLSLRATHDFQISETHQNAIASDEAFFWVYGLLNYRDFLGHLHESRFCFRWFGVDPGVGSDTPEGFIEAGPDDYHRQT